MDQKHAIGMYNTMWYSIVQSPLAVEVRVKNRGTFVDTMTSEISVYPAKGQKITTSTLL